MTQDAAEVVPAGALTHHEPWLGLESYAEADEGLFYGREAETRDLMRLVERETLTVVFGPSGTGKTSLLNAGLFPVLRANNYLPLYVRLDHAAIEGSHARRTLDALLAAAAEYRIEAEVIGAPAAADATETLWERLHRTVFWSARNEVVTPVLVFDQFEEIFTLGRNRPQSEAFLTELSDLVENYIPQAVRERIETTGRMLSFAYKEQRYRVMLSLREDFVSALEVLRRAMPSVMHNRYALRRMTGAQALRAVVYPGRDVVDEAVAQQIVRFVAGQRADVSDPTATVPLETLTIEPALLSVVCRELNIRRQNEGRPRITPDLVDASHTDILDDFYERAFKGLDTRARIFVEDQLLTPGGFRSTAPLEEALEAGVAKAAIDALIDRRLLRSEERLGIPHLELTHDVLAGVVQRSKAARHQREQLEEAEQARVTAEAERAAQARVNRRTRTQLAVAVALLIVAIAAVAIAVRFYLAATSTRDALRMEAMLRAQAQLKEATALKQERDAQDRRIRDMVAASWKVGAYFSEFDKSAFGDSWIYGARVFYAKMKPIMNLDVMKSLSPEPVFVSGPHGSDFTFTASDFGHYNPKFLEWAQKYAVPGAEDPVLRRFTQPMYDRYIRSLARGYYDTYHYLRQQPDVLARVVKGYQEAVDADRKRGPRSSGRPSAYLREAFDQYAQSYGKRGWFSRPAQAGTNLDFYYAGTAAGFWVRRTIDGTAQQWYRLLEKLIGTYDPQWLRKDPA